MVGRSVLELGRPAGTVLTAGAEGRSDDLPKLVEALEEDNGEAPAAADHGVGADANAIVERASDVTAQVERANTLFNEVADGRLSPGDVKDEVDVLLGLLGRLDREGRWSEALALARALSGLLGLIRRWLELVRSLRTALGAANKLGDLDALGWAEHELGSLHLAGENAAAAERRLGQAREIRQRLGDRDGLAVTDHNLQALCRMLRQLLRDGRLTQDDERDQHRRHRRILTLAVAVLLLVGGGVAGAVIRGSDGNVNDNASHNSAGATPANDGQNAGNSGGQAADQTAPNVTISAPPSGDYAPGTIRSFTGTAGVAEGDLPTVTVAIDPSGTASAASSTSGSAIPVASASSETSAVALSTSSSTAAAPTTSTTGPSTTTLPPTSTTSTTTTTSTPSPPQCGAPPDLSASVQSDGSWNAGQPQGLVLGCRYVAVASQSDQAGITGKSNPVTLSIVRK